MVVKISLIIPVYNESNFVTRCLNSVARQISPEVQVIIVDDGSTDGSDKICDQYAERYGFEVYHRQNKGVSEARNFGIKKAKGEYLAFLDADDSLVENALHSMLAWTDSAHNVIQFNHSRYIYGPDNIPAQRLVAPGRYDLDHTPKYWLLIWNKLYKRSFILEKGIRFIPKMQFGEDEMFNVECMIANDGLYHVFDISTNHYFDNKNSLCRGELGLDRLMGLDKALNKRRDEAKQAGDERAAAWINRVIDRHHRSKTFRMFGYRDEPTGRYDIVYFVKNDPNNEELRYSLRSVEENWKYRDVWFYGGCPAALKPDHHVELPQIAASKFERVRDMMRKVCENDEITEDFWLFNDDFFVLKPVSEIMPPQYAGTLHERIVNIEERHGQAATRYTKRLRHLVKTLKKARKGFLNYAVHKPMLINRKKMLEVLNTFPDEPMIRALYGNYWGIGGVSKHDMKIELLDYNNMDVLRNEWEFVSTSDDSFKSGNVGAYLRLRFNNKSRFERS